MRFNPEHIEKVIDYHFQNKDILQQAFVRRSYSEQYGGQNNEVLEFIGDKALDLAVIQILTAWFGVTTDDKQWKEFKLKNPSYFSTKTKEGIFTDIKKDLVQKKTLAKCIDQLGFNKMLIMGKGDREQSVDERDSVKEDLFEAIIGAVAVDSNYDMKAIVSVVETMIDFESYFTNWEEYNINYVGRLQEWSQSCELGIPEYRYQNRTLFGNNEVSCIVTIPKLNRNPNSWTGSAESKSKARMEAARNAYLYLQKNGDIVSEYEEEVGYPDAEESLRQINELVQKRMISKPDYTFEQDVDDNGNDYWNCDCSIPEIDESNFTGQGYTKKVAQREAAYSLLLYLMGYEEEDK